MLYILTTKISSSYLENNMSSIKTMPASHYHGMVWNPVSFYKHYLDAYKGAKHSLSKVKRIMKAFMVYGTNDILAKFPAIYLLELLNKGVIQKSDVQDNIYSLFTLLFEEGDYENAEKLSKFLEGGPHGYLNERFNHEVQVHIYGTGLGYRTENGFDHIPRDLFNFLNELKYI